MTALPTPRVALLDRSEPAWAAVRTAFEDVLGGDGVSTRRWTAVQQWDGVVAAVCSGAAFLRQHDRIRADVPAETPLFVVDLEADAQVAGVAHTVPNTFHVDTDRSDRELRALLEAYFHGGDGTAPAAGVADDTPAVEDLYASAFAEVGDPIVVANDETDVVTAVNDAAVDLTGRSRGSLLGSHQRELYPPSKAAQYAAVVNRAAEQDGRANEIRDDARAESEIRDDARAENEIRDDVRAELVEIRTADGELVPVDVSTSFVTVEGTPHRVSVFRDATDRLDRLEQTRRQAAAMDVSLTGIAITDASGEYVYMNEAHAAILGYEAEELLGGSWEQIYDADWAEYVRTTAFPTLEADGVWKGELVGRRRDGSSAPQLVNLTSLPDGGVVCVNQDISDQKRTEGRLRAIRERVEALMLAEGRDALVDELIGATTDVVDRPLVSYWTYDADRERLTPLSTSRAAAERLASPPTFDRDGGPLWDAFEAGELRYLPEETELTRSDGDEIPLRSAVVLPIGRHGVLRVSSTAVDDFSRTDLELLRILGTHADTAFTLLDRENALRDARDRIDAERQQLREVVDHIPQLVFAKTRDGEFVLVNEAVAEAYGTTVDELEGQTDAAFARNDAEVEAFREDDLAVLEAGEPVHRPEETLTDAAGNERILNTWKVPFTPAGSDEQAVLGVATDITDYKEAELALRRQQKLTELNRIGRSLLTAETTDEVYATAVDPTVRALSATAVSVYDFDAEAGVLERTASAGETTVTESITPREAALWNAFSQQETRTLEASEHAAADEALVLVPLDDFGLLVVAADSGDVDLTFVETAARILTAALQRTVHVTQVSELDQNLTRTRAELRERDQLATAFRTAQRRIRQATTGSRVHEALVAFATTVWDDAWVGKWHARDDHITPVCEATAGGPATAHGDTDAASAVTSPPLTAAATNEAVSVANTLTDDRYDHWSGRLLNFGYQSSIAVPISHNGLVRGALEVLSLSPDAFDEEAVASLTELCHRAGTTLARLATPSGGGDRVELDVEWSTDPPFFSDVPDSVRLTVSETASTSEDRFRIEGQAHAPSRDDVERYFDAQQGFFRPTVVAGVDDHVFPFEVTVAVPSVPPLDALCRVLDDHDAAVVSASSDPDDEVVTLRSPHGTTRSVCESLERAVGDCRLLAKRAVEDSPATGVGTALEALTDRQREVLSAAYQRGYFDQPKSVTGDELAAQFGVSRSTIHQHLRAGERNLLGTLLGTDR
ncbi:PAS domain S-box protein [Halobellus sp. Atlit-31R]|nr:PAS domain S-box protein [Halobellus sp. Atlit-31R]